MGYYVNPTDCTKEKWLKNNATSTPDLPPQWNDIPSDQLPVCLIDNMIFTAAGVAFDERELEAFSQEDHRPKRWYIIPISKLQTVVVPKLPS